MKLPWFILYGFLFVPKNLVAWVIFLCAIVYSVYSFIEIDSRSHSVSDTLMNFVFRLFLIGVVYSLIALLINFAASERRQKYF
jgi:prepilin signal peptidase PulO-like enzyme (type II secretory pathway)